VVEVEGSRGIEEVSLRTVVVGVELDVGWNRERVGRGKRETGGRGETSSRR